MKYVSDFYIETFHSEHDSYTLNIRFGAK